MKLPIIHILMVYMTWDILVEMLCEKLCRMKPLFSIIYSTNEMDEYCLESLVYEHLLFQRATDTMPTSWQLGEKAEKAENLRTG
jgi:hypothetical protein